MSGDAKEEAAFGAPKTMATLAVKKDARDRKRRGSISAESIKPNATPAPRVVHAKSDEAKAAIARTVKNNLLFRHLDGEQLSLVIDAMFEKQVAKDETVIRQGDEGDFFYVVATGSFDIFVARGKSPAEKVLTVGPGGSFGELALMYNAPRAATCTATVESTVWALDRTTFNGVVLDTTVQRRKQYEKFLTEIPLLSTLTPAEISKVADVLQVTTYKDGDYIIRQGEEGNHFYLIEDGAARVEIVKDSVAVEVGRLVKNTYVGELALLSDRPRAASVIATGDCRAVSLDRAAFTRLLGGCREQLKKNMRRYKSYEACLAATSKTGGTSTSSSDAPAPAADPTASAKPAAKTPVKGLQVNVTPAEPAPGEASSSTGVSLAPPSHQEPPKSPRSPKPTILVAPSELQPVVVERPAATVTGTPMGTPLSTPSPTIATPGGTVSLRVAMPIGTPTSSNNSSRRNSRELILATPVVAALQGLERDVVWDGPLQQRPRVAPVRGDFDVNYAMADIRAGVARTPVAAMRRNSITRGLQVHRPFGEMISNVPIMSPLSEEVSTPIYDVAHGQWPNSAAQAGAVMSAAPAVMPAPEMVVAMPAESTPLPATTVTYSGGYSSEYNAAPMQYTSTASYAPSPPVYASPSASYYVAPQPQSQPTVWQQPAMYAPIQQPRWYPAQPYGFPPAPTVIPPPMPAPGYGIPPLQWGGPAYAPMGGYMPAMYRPGPGFW